MFKNVWNSFKAALGVLLLGKQYPISCDQHEDIRSATINMTAGDAQHLNKLHNIMDSGLLHQADEDMISQEIEALEKTFGLIITERIESKMEKKRVGVSGFLSAAMAFAAAAKGGAARYLPSLKGGIKRKSKRSGGKRTGAKYQWGTLGLSYVSDVIQKQTAGHGILSRRDRRSLAREFSGEFTPVYNGPVYRGNGGRR